LDEVLFLVPERLPHRQPEEATLAQRLMLLEVALARSDRFSLAVSSHGLFVDMARAIEPHYPSATRMFFLVGNDAAHRILRWNYQDRAEARKQMFARFDLIVATRAGELQIPTDPELQPYAGQIHPLTLGPDVQQVSATAVRERVRTGRPLTGLVAPEVAAAIERWQLYRSG
jgi:nicotinic acid mononucleotide adenylyltransferase